MSGVGWGGSTDEHRVLEPQRDILRRLAKLASPTPTEQEVERMVGKDVAFRCSYGDVVWIDGQEHDIERIAPGSVYFDGADTWHPRPHFR